MSRPRLCLGLCVLLAFVTGTTKMSVVTNQKRGAKTVIVQRDADLRDLRPNQGVAVIYTTGQSGPVLLAAVVQPAGER
jgi:hypothetical protein